MTSVSKIALDAMGGDFAPESIVLGALEAAPLVNATIVLVGKEEEIKKLLPATLPKNIEIRNATEVIEMDDKPVEALRKKKDSSLNICIQMVKEGEAGVMVSAGNTGAATAGTLLNWRQLSGIHRPAIASTLPNAYGQFLLLDAGASPDVSPEHLIEFAVMGKVYAEKMHGKKNPRVHLLNIGEEPGKGNAFAKQVQTLMEPHAWYAGNCEGKDLMHSDLDVVVCDAFVGNIVLKTAEGVSEFFLQYIKDNVPTGPIAKLPYFPLKKLFAPLKKRMDYAEYGGSPLLGLNHLCIICHGRSSAKAMKNALIQADKSIQADLINIMRANIIRELPQL